MAEADAKVSVDEAAGGVGARRTTSNMESDLKFPRVDADVNIEEAWNNAGFSWADRNRLWFDTMMQDSRRHMEGFHNQYMLHLSNVQSQVLDAQKKGTDNLWSQRDEIEAVVTATLGKVLSEMAKPKS